MIVQFFGHPYEDIVQIVEYISVLATKIVLPKSDELSGGGCVAE